MGGRGGGGSLSDAAVGARVTASIHALENRPGGMVRIAKLRDRLSNIERERLTANLVRLAKARQISLTPDDDQKNLTKADRAGAVRYGDRLNHLVSIQP